MPLKDILTVVTGPSQEGAFAAAEVLRGAGEAHLAILYLARQPEAIVGDPAYTATLWAAVAENMSQVAASDFDAVAKRAAAISKRTEVRREDVFVSTVEDVVARHAMHSDLTIMQAPTTMHEDAAFEAALFRSGRPVLVAPAKFDAATIGKRVVIAWKPKREAARAVADAAPLLVGAESVTVVTVDVKQDDGGAAAGRDIAANLARRGLNVEVRNVDGMGQPAEVALLNEARALGADLIVMGGYGHSRVREFVFGGVTRALSRTSPIPVLMSH